MYHAIIDLFRTDPRIHTYKGDKVTDLLKLKWNPFRKPVWVIINRTPGLCQINVIYLNGSVGAICLQPGQYHFVSNKVVRIVNVCYLLVRANLTADTLVQVKTPIRISKHKFWIPIDPEPEDNIMVFSEFRDIVRRR